MGETENIDEYKRALAVLHLEAGNPLEMIGIFVKYVQRMRRKLRSIGTDAFKDKHYNNTPAILTRTQRHEVTAIRKTATSKDHGYVNSKFWSTRILATVIKRRYDILYSSRTSY